MENEYVEILRRTGEAWEAYWDAARSEFGEGTKAESARCAALWTEFHQCVIRLTTMREKRRNA
jgi:hypothetical protein